MDTITHHITFKKYRFEELSEIDQQLIEKAKEATYRSYTPYSKFNVGAAALLGNDIIVTGSNQENAAYPSGLCAERTTLFYANSQYPDQPVTTLAIAARDEKGFLVQPISPCGACRQVILETQNRFGNKLRILLYGENAIYDIATINDLLPLSFDKDFLID